MTKPRNFPGRKQERRIRALARLQKALEEQGNNVSYGLALAFTKTIKNIETGGFKLTKKRCPSGRKNRKSK